MPIYEYQCQACQHEFEKLQKISDPLLEECPECHQPELKKKISAAGFRLSGSGWYETDFKKDGKKKNLAQNETAAAEGGAAKDDSKKSSDVATSGNKGQDSGGSGTGGKAGGSTAAAKE